MATSVEVTVGDVLQCVEPLERLANQPICMKSAQAILDIKASIGPAAFKFQEDKNALLAKMGTPIEDQPNQWRIESEALDQFHQEIKDLTDVKITVASGITKELLGEAKMSANDLDCLSPFIV